MSMRSQTEGDVDRMRRYPAIVPIVNAAGRLFLPQWPFSLHARIFFVCLYLCSPAACPAQELSSPARLNPSYDAADSSATKPHSINAAAKDGIDSLQRRGSPDESDVPGARRHVDDSRARAGFTANAGLDVVSRYVWRGLPIGDKPRAPHVQPGIYMQYAHPEAGILRGFLWASYGVADGYSTYSIDVSYSRSTMYGEFTAGMTDYYYPFEEKGLSNFRGGGEGAHTLELYFAFTGPEIIPLNLLFASNIHNDVHGDKSFYAEAGYTADWKGFLFRFFAAGAAGVSNYYGIAQRGWRMLQTGVTVERDIELSERHVLPVAATLLYNPYADNVYAVFRVSYYFALID
jgi:hypothetical protein